jgi:hypothetical protein
MKIAWFIKFACPITGLLAGVLLASCGAGENSAAPESNIQPVAYAVNVLVERCDRRKA